MRYKEEILHYEGGEALEQVAKWSCGYPLPGTVQGQVGWGFEQPDLVEDVSAHGRGGGTLMSFPTQTILWFHDSMISFHENSKLKWPEEKMKIQNWSGLKLSE